MLIKDTNIENIVSKINTLQVTKDEAVLILIGENHPIDLKALVDDLNQKNISFFGGIFPGIIYGKERFEDNIIARKFPVLDAPYLIHGLEGTDISLPNFHSAIHKQKATAVTLVDGLTANIASFLTDLYNVLGNNIDYFGGGAGSLTLQQKPCLIHNDGVFQDAAIVCLVKQNISLGVRHGWEKIMGPLIATKTDKNKIIDLNWQNAFEVYKSTVDEDSKQSINVDNFFDIAKGYPFGIYKEGEEDIVRDPIMVGENGELICVGEVPENTMLYILKGRSQSLIDSAQQAAADASNHNDTIESAMVIDCISRVLFLQDNFGEELKAITTQIELPAHEVVKGALTLGEISSYGEGLLEFFNKTIVVGTFKQERNATV